MTWYAGKASNYGLSPCRFFLLFNVLPRLVYHLYTTKVVPLCSIASSCTLPICHKPVLPPLRFGCILMLQQLRNSYNLTFSKFLFPLAWNKSQTTDLWIWVISQNIYFCLLRNICKAHPFAVPQEAQLCSF